MNKITTAATTTPRLIGYLLLTSVLAGCRFGGDDDPPAATTSLAVDPPAITLGQSATLAWSSAPGATCDASGSWDGAKPPVGAVDVTPSATGDIVFTLTCSGSATRSVTLRVVAASAYVATSLVEDLAGGAAQATDSLLVNPWGLAFTPVSAIWVANNHGDSATIYDGNGRSSPLIVHFPSGADEASFGATGVVYNGVVPDFIVASGGQSGPALFVFAGESGRLMGWSPEADIFNAAVAYAAADGAVYKGLALANDGSGNFLYATDFANGKVDVFDAAFVKQTATAAHFAFEDPTLPEGYAPFGIQAVDAGLATLIYVSYAKRDEAEPDDDAPGPGLGLIDVFDADGHLLKHLVAQGGKLNAPWGMALAPPDFGTLSNALLVGNFGDGTIHGYDPVTGRYRGAVTDGSLTPLAVPGLWGIAFGNDAVNQPHATLFFAAGTNGETHGLYGRIDLGELPPVLGPIPFVTLIAPEGELNGTVALTADVESSVAVTKVQFYLNGGTLIGTATGEPFTVQWNTIAFSNADVTLRAVATDANGDVGSSAILTVSVDNSSGIYGGVRTLSEMSGPQRTRF